VLPALMKNEWLQHPLYGRMTGLLDLIHIDERYDGHPDVGR
jgi:hypothetical protein